MKIIRNSILSVFAFLLTFTALSYSQNNFTKCPILTCSNQEPTETVCMTVSEVSSNQKNYTFTECAQDGYVCPFNQDTDYSLSDTLVCANKDTTNTNKLPGQGCNKNNECVSNNCDGDICMGLKLGAKCLSHSYCEEETYCKKDNQEDTEGTCTTQIYDNTSYCYDDYACANEFICYENKCQTPYTLEDGKLTTNIKMCRSNYAVSANDETNAGLIICDSYIINQDSFECSSTQNTCEYTLNYSKTTISLDCVCALTDTEKRRCPADYSEDFMNDMAYNYITVDKAHTLLRDYSNWEMKHYNREWPNKDILECVEKAINSNIVKLNIFALLISFIFVIIL